MGYGRNMPMAGGIDPDMIAAIASDPEGFKARKQELQAAYDAACAASQEATQRRADLNEKEQGLNTRDAQLTAAEARHYDALAALELAKTSFESQAAARLDILNAREILLKQRVRELDDRESSIALSENAADAALRSAKSDRDVAAVRLAKLNDIANSLDSLKAHLATIGNA